MSLYRCVGRLRDRFGPRADTDPGARAGLAPHNAETERRDGRRARVATTSPTTGSRKRLTKKPRPSKTPPSSPSETNHQKTIITTETVSAKDRGQRLGTEVFPGFNFGLDEATTGTGSGTKPGSKTPENDTKEADSGRQGQRRNTPPSPSPGNLSKSSTVSSFLDSKRSEARRRKRKKSDSRPGYFDPGPFAKDSTGGDTEVEIGGDNLVMNIPSRVEE